MQLICASDTLQNGGKGCRFFARFNGVDEPAFAVRYGGVAYAYLNRCSHVPTELDWVHGVFFDSDGRYLICATHGALYSPESGYCVGGRCNGKGLIGLKVLEVNECVYLID